MSKKPQVEITGLEARYYDSLLNIISFGAYSKFIRRVISDLPLSSEGGTPEEIIMDLGAGTGKNAQLMLERLGPDSKVFALEIGKEMREQLEERQKRDSRIAILDQRIEQPFQLPEKATVAFIAFVIHGMSQDKRLAIIENVRNNMRSGGHFCILDYNHFSVDDAPWYARFGVRKMECKPTEDFIRRDWQAILEEKGFHNFEVKTYFRNYIRLLCAVLS